ncbi:MAG: hypothetical protein ACRD0Z_10710 [Acidimicrobiales bacterium]
MSPGPAGQGQAAGQRRLIPFVGGGRLLAPRALTDDSGFPTLVSV